jgi:hypothetical protein
VYSFSASAEGGASAFSTGGVGGGGSFSNSIWRMMKYSSGLPTGRWLYAVPGGAEPGFTMTMSATWVKEEVTP